MNCNAYLSGDLVTVGVNCCGRTCPHWMGYERACSYDDMGMCDLWEARQEAMRALAAGILKQAEEEKKQEWP